MDLLAAWANWIPKESPLVLHADRPFLESLPPNDVVTLADWPSAYSADDFGEPSDGRLHVGLIPQPFLGDLRNASVYVLLLNPGLSPADYYGETVPAFRAALLANLKQEFGSNRSPFLFLDPQFSWHAGYGWWHSKLAGVIDGLAEAWDLSFASARQHLATKIASIEMFPYHSATFRNPGGLLRKLDSVALARAFVHDVALTRSQRGEAITIITRQARAWGIATQPGVIVYNQGQARAAHLSPNSPGGRAIIDFLLHQDRTRRLGVRAVPSDD